MDTKQFELEECDDTGNVVATYVQTATDQNDMSRVDIILPEVRKSPLYRLLDVFLPSGYPNSVTSDYLEYQIYDSLQAFASSIAGLLSSRAVLSSVGVGDSSASPTAALLLSVFQESVGRVATILFAHRFGMMLEPECKMYRLLADILNDIAFILDCLSPAFPKPVRVIILSFSSVLRALCGVAAGSAKASLSAHFARWGNLGELNAKDSSQETVISLLGMLAGSLIVPMVKTSVATWSTLILLLSIHLETNRRAVRAVNMQTFNRQRATLTYHHLTHGHVPTPKEISQEERVFEWNGTLRDTGRHSRGHCTIGSSFHELLRLLAPPHNRTKSTSLQKNVIPQLIDLYRDREYILWYTATSEIVKVYIVIKKPATTRDLLTAWWQAIVIMNKHTREQTPATGAPVGKIADLNKEKVELLVSSMVSAKDLVEKNAEKLENVGWDLDVGALETTSNKRLVVPG